MLQPAEVTAAKLLPTIRARLAQELLEVHRLKQVQVARSLGITQAAVSHYNTKSRGLDQDLMRRFPEIEAFCVDVAARIAAGMVQTDHVSVIHPVTEGLMHTAPLFQEPKKGSDHHPNLAGLLPAPPPPSG